MAFPPWITYRELIKLHSQRWLEQLQESRLSYDFALEINTDSKDFLDIYFLHAKKVLGRPFYPAYPRVFVLEVRVNTVKDEAAHNLNIKFMNDVLTKFRQTLTFTDDYFERGEPNVVQPVPFCEEFSRKSVKEYARKHFNFLSDKFLNLHLRHICSFKETSLGAVINFKKLYGLSNNVRVSVRFNVTYTHGNSDVNCMVEFMNRFFNKIIT